MTYALRNFMMFSFVGLIIGGLWMIGWGMSTLCNFQPPILRTEPAVVQRAVDAALRAAIADDLSTLPVGSPPIDLT